MSGRPPGETHSNHGRVFWRPRPDPLPTRTVGDRPSARGGRAGTGLRRKGPIRSSLPYRRSIFAQFNHGVGAVASPCEKSPTLTNECAKVES